MGSKCFLITKRMEFKGTLKSQHALTLLPGLTEDAHDLATRSIQKQLRWNYTWGGLSCVHVIAT